MPQHLSSQIVHRFAWGLILAALLLKFVSLFLASVHPDTSYYLNIATNYIERGGLTPYMWRIDPAANIIAGSGTGYGVLILITWLQIFGVTVLSGNLLAYLASVASLIVLYFVVIKLWKSSTIALLAVAYMAASTVFFRNASLRMDALGSLSYCLVLLLHITAIQKNRWWLHFLVGIAVIAAAEIHLQATAYVGGITFYYGITHLQALLKARRVWKWTPALAYGLGLGLAAAIYLVVRILPNPAEYFLIPGSCNICVPAGLLAEFIRYTAVLVYSPVEAVLLILAVIAAVKRRQFADQYFLLVLVGAVITMAILSPPPIYIQYFGHITPIIALGVGAFIARGTQSAENLESRRLAAAFFGGCLVLVLTTATMRSWYMYYDPADPRLTYIREHLPEDTVVTSRPWLYHLLIDYTHYLSYHDGEKYGITLRGEDYTTFWQRERPQVVISDIPPPQDEPELWAYMQLHRFEEVLPGLWLEPGAY